MNPDTNESHSAASKKTLFVLLIACLVYVQAVTFPFLHLDDTIYIVENGYVHKWKSLPSFFTGSAESVGRDKAPPVANLYRPLPAIWLLLNYKLFGVHPALWHISALGLYLLGVWLVWRVAWKLTHDEFVSLAGSLIYALHPTHVEGVAWVSGAAVDTLLSVLFFSAFLAYLRWREEGRWLWLAVCGTLTLLAFFAKETAAALPILMLAHNSIFRSRSYAAADRGRSQLPLAITTIAAVGTYALLRLHALHSVVVSRPQHSWGDVFRTAPLAFVTYLQHAFWPVHLALWYEVRIVTAPGLTNFYLPLAVCVAWTALISWVIAREPLDGFLLLWWTISLAAPIVGIVTFPEFAIVQDRMSFVAVAGLAMVVARLLARIPNRNERVLFGFNATATVAGFALAAALGMLSAAQVNTWKSDLVMLSHAIEVTPMSVRPRVLLGAEYLKLGDPGRSVAAYRAAVDLAPNRWEILYSYGIALASNGNRPEAIRAMQRSIQVSPTMTPPYMVAADLLYREGRLDEAIATLESGVPIVREPDFLRGRLAPLLRVRHSMAEKQKR